MKTIRMALGRKLSNDLLDARFVQLLLYFGAVAIVPMSLVALLKHPGSWVDLVFGLGLACLLGALLAISGALIRRLMLANQRSLRSRRPEIASYAAGIGLLVMGLRWLPGLELNPAQIAVGLLLILSLSFAVMVLGMMTTVARSIK
jgi:hypothetical protein